MISLGINDIIRQVMTPWGPIRGCYQPTQRLWLSFSTRPALQGWRTRAGLTPGLCWTPSEGRPSQWESSSAAEKLRVRHGLLLILRMGLVFLRVCLKTTYFTIELHIPPVCHYHCYLMDTQGQHVKQQVISTQELQPCSLNACLRLLWRKRFLF